MRSAEAASPGQGPDGASDQPREDIRGGVEDRQEEEHRRSHRDANEVVVLVDRVVGVGAPHREPGSNSAQRHAVATRDHRNIALDAGDTARGQHSERAAGNEQHRGGGAAEAPLHPRREDRQANRDDKQVADVDVGKGGGDDTATTRLRPGRSGRRRSPGAHRSPSDDEQKRCGAEDRGERRVRAAGAAGPRGGAGGDGICGRPDRGAALASSAPPRRSSFGARLRNRAPQYGHSVT